MLTVKLYKIRIKLNVVSKKEKKKRKMSSYYLYYYVGIQYNVLRINIMNNEVCYDAVCSPLTIKRFFVFLLGKLSACSGGRVILFLCILVSVSKTFTILIKRNIDVYTFSS